MVLIYSRPTCVPCRNIKYWLKKQGIAFTEKDADENNVAHTPSIEIEGIIMPVQSIGQLIRLLA